MISCLVLTIYALQPPRLPSLPQIIVLMQATTILTLTDRWISTRSVDRDMEEDVQNLATLMKHLPSCMYAADIEQLPACKTFPSSRRWWFQPGRWRRL